MIVSFAIGNAALANSTTVLVMFYIHEIISI